MAIIGRNGRGGRGGLVRSCDLTRTQRGLFGSVFVSASGSPDRLKTNQSGPPTNKSTSCWLRVPALSSLHLHLSIFPFNSSENPVCTLCLSIRSRDLLREFLFVVCITPAQQCSTPFFLFFIAAPPLTGTTSYSINSTRSLSSCTEEIPSLSSQRPSTTRSSYASFRGRLPPRWLSISPVRPVASFPLPIIRHQCCLLQLTRFLLPRTHQARPTLLN